jgi:hypothetical protein
MRAMLWHTLRGTMPDECRIRKSNGKLGSLPIFGTDWPSYGFDEWFLIAALYPRLAPSGVLTFFPINQKEANHWFSLDIEYVTWANPRSEILYFGEPEILRKPKRTARKKDPKSGILEGMLREKASSPATAGFADRGEQETLTLVVARYREDLGWLLELPEDVTVVVYNKGGSISDARLLQRIDHLVRLPNQGREADTYLYHVEHFPHGDANEWTVFCQGDPFPHSRDFLELLKQRDIWAEVQPLTSGYLDDGISPPQVCRDLETGEWLRGLPVRTELLSAHTLRMVRWYDPAGGGFIQDYCDHVRLPAGWSVTGYFLESCGWTSLAREAWKATLVRGVYAAIFGVRNERLSFIPRKCLPRMRKIASEHPSTGYVHERLWLHLFGLPFITLEEASAVDRPRRALELVEA